MKHDPLCSIAKGPCCEWMGNCDCQCMCDFIKAVRRDEDQILYKTLHKSVVDERVGWFGYRSKYERGRNDVLVSLMKYLEMRLVQREIR